MKAIAVVVMLVCHCAALAAGADTPKTDGPAATAPRQSSGISPARNRLPVTAVTSTGPGQAGYIHFFIITDIDGALETQVGIELDDQRIAWSVPGLGVNVSPFIADGTIGAEGRVFKVRHLYGLRPFPDNAAMHTLQKSMLSRIIPLIEDDTPYCYLRPLKGDFCLNCLGFAMRVLFPGPTAVFPTLPADFARKGADSFYTTEDMLLYMAGMHGIPTAPARLQRVAQLDIPQKLRDDLALLAADSELDAMTVPAEAEHTKIPLRSLVGRPRATDRNLKAKPATPY
jgi:hypothetical protein